MGYKETYTAVVQHHALGPRGEDNNMHDVACNGELNSSFYIVQDLGSSVVDRTPGNQCLSGGPFQFFFFCTKTGPGTLWRSNRQ